MINTRPKAIVFDLGKVLVDFDYSIAARKIAARCSFPLDNLSRFLSQSPLLFRYETGLIGRRQFYDEICRETGFGGEFDEFGSFFADIFTPIPEMNPSWTAAASSIPSYIFSNTNDLAISHIRGNFPFFSNFDGYILSYEHGSMKPDVRLYEVVEDQTGSRGPEILYLDDRPENIATGNARGWQVILQENPAQTLAAFRESGLLK